MRRGVGVLAAAAMTLSVVLIVDGPSGSAAAPEPASAAPLLSPSTPSMSPSTSSPSDPLPKGPERHYVWADDTGLDGNTVITLVHGATPRQALGLLKSMHTDDFTVPTPVEKAATAIAWSERGAYNSQSLRDSVIAGSLPDGWTVLCGQYGIYDFDTKAVARLSRPGTSITVFEDINLDTQFTYALKGKVARTFDPFDSWGYTGKRLPQEKGIPFGHTDWPMADSLYLTQLLSKVHLSKKDVTPTKSWLGIGLKS